MDIQAAVRALWDRHAADPAGVAQALQALATAPPAAAADIGALLRLGHHVLGEHLGHWDQGIALVRRLAASAAADAQTQAAAARFVASLSLAAGRPGPRDALDAGDAITATALAAAGLVPHDTARAAALLKDAVARHGAAGLPDDAPCVRALAVTGNNLACELEERPTRSDAERSLMLMAAQTSRRFWALAGGWLEVERAEYRLAMSHLKAGDAAQARVHAEACLAIVEAHGNVPLEQFFGLEARCLAARAAGEADAAAAALSALRQVFAHLPADDQRGCRQTLDRTAAG
jgi:hypothetical protein